MTERSEERLTPVPVDSWSPETREVLLRYLRRSAFIGFLWRMGFRAG